MVEMVEMDSISIFRELNLSRVCGLQAEQGHNRKPRAKKGRAAELHPHATYYSCALQVVATQQLLLFCHAANGGARNYSSR